MEPLGISTRNGIDPVGLGQFLQRTRRHLVACPNLSYGRDSGQVMGAKRSVSRAE